MFSGLASTGIDFQVLLPENIGHFGSIGQRREKIAEIAPEFPQPLNQHEHDRLKQHELADLEVAGLPFPDHQINQQQLYAERHQALHGKGDEHQQPGDFLLPVDEIRGLVDLSLLFGFQGKAFDDEDIADGVGIGAADFRIAWATAWSKRSFQIE